MRLFLQFFSLSDRYERKAQLLPGLLLAAVPALTFGSVLQEFASWYAAASTAIGVEFLAAIVLGKFAQARGRRVEEKLWKTWGGPPTTRWLRPWDQTCSDQQKQKWRGAIKRLTGMTLPASVPLNGNEEEADRAISDVMRQLRYGLRGKPEAAMIAIHNEDYGFARNLCGVRCHWVLLSFASVTACGVAFAFGMRPFLGIAISGGFVIASLFIALELPHHVKRCADRYAESLFATAIVVSQSMDDVEKQTNDSTASKDA